MKAERLMSTTSFHSMPFVWVHVRVGERDPPAGRLVCQVTDDPAIGQRLVEAGGLVLAHLNGGR
jgi:hypothetical protein